MKKARQVIAVILSALLCSCDTTRPLPAGTFIAAGTGKQVVKTDVGGLTPKQAASAIGQQVLAQLAVLGIQYGTAMANAYIQKHMPQPVAAQK